MLIGYLERCLASEVAISDDRRASANEVVDGVLADFCGAAGVRGVVVHGGVCVAFLTPNKPIISESFLLYRQGGVEQARNRQRVVA